MSQAQDDLNLALEARRKVLSGQTVRWGDRQRTRADLGLIEQTITRLKREVMAEKAKARGQGGPTIARFC